MKREIALAKLEVVKDMTDVEGVRQLCDLLSDIISGTELIPERTPAIGFEMFNEDEYEIEDKKKK